MTRKSWSSRFCKLGLVGSLAIGGVIYSSGGFASSTQFVNDDTKGSVVIRSIAHDQNKGEVVRNANLYQKNRVTENKPFSIKSRVVNKVATLLCPCGSRACCQV
jgi:hypothetical protein